MALQAYLPDSFAMLRELTAWARQRVADGGSPSKFASSKAPTWRWSCSNPRCATWPLAPFDNKLDVDANWKRMVAFALMPENIRAVRLGVASHNLFDVAFAYLLARRNEVTDFFTFEMIEGMANHVRRAVHETGQDFLAYAHCGRGEVFHQRHRLSNPAPGRKHGSRNFLRHLNQLKTGTAAWDMLAEHFRASVRRMPTVGVEPHRTQNRLTETFPRRRDPLHDGSFPQRTKHGLVAAANAPGRGIRRRWMKGPGNEPIEVPLVAAAERSSPDARSSSPSTPTSFRARWSWRVAPGQGR